MALAKEQIRQIINQNDITSVTVTDTYLIHINEGLAS